MPTLFNYGAVTRRAREEIFKALIFLLLLSLMLLVILSLVFKSFEKCEGAFGDTVHLNLRDHPNYRKLFHGKCKENHKAHGHKVDDHKFPFIARFVYVNNTEKFVGCSGTLLSDNLVLTAAHCISDDIKFEIHLGGTPENNFIDSIVVTEFTKILHPKYNASQFINDIGLIKFKNSIKFTHSVNRACIPLQDAKVPINLTLTGWSDGNSVDYPMIDEMIVSRIDLLNCSQKYYDLVEFKAWKRVDPTVRLNDLPKERKPRDMKINYKPITTNQFCAGEKTRKRGNSGMPASFRNSDNGAFTVYGLISYGANENHQMPTVFTKIYEYRHWILCKA